MANVDAGGLELLGPDGVLAELTERLLERGLSEELAEHLGYEAGDPAGHRSGNNRNGTTPKTVLTEIGAVDLDVPRDRNGTFDPQLVPKHARRLEGFNENIVHLYIVCIPWKRGNSGGRRVVGAPLRRRLSLSHRGGDPAGHSRAALRSFDGLVGDRGRDVIGFVLGPGLEWQEASQIALDFRAVGAGLS